MQTTHPTTDPAEPATNSSEPVAELRSLTKSYFKPDGTIMVEALRGVDVSITRGEYVAIMGASGSGKSTMMNILGCLDQPTAGEYLLDGRDVSKMTDEELSSFRGKRVGFVFQAFNLIPQLKIEDNIAVPLFYQHVGKQERYDRAIEVLKMVDLDDRVGHRPAELSGGQQQRAAIARALAINPVILMADEPTGNLDSKTGEAILDLFDELHAQGMTIIMVTHDAGVSGRCNRIIRLRDGLVESDERVNLGRVGV